MAMQHPESHSPPGANGSPGYQDETVSLRGVIWFAIIFIGFAIVSQVMLWAVYSRFHRQASSVDVRRSALAPEQVVTPPPRLQPSPGQDSTPWQDMDQLRRAEREDFARRGWIDAKTGQVVIPDQIVKQVQGMRAKATTRPRG